MKKNIMVIDDDKVTASLIPFILKGEGYKVIAYQDGAEALDKFDDNPPDLVLLDIKMPELDGFEVCSAIKSRADTSSIPVIMMTASDKLGDAETAFERGAEEFLTKPIEKDKLLAKVEKYLG